MSRPTWNDFRISFFLKTRKKYMLESHPTPYKYEALPLVTTPDTPHWTRIFALGPGVGDEPLSGRLETISIPTSKLYEALSYVWTRKEPTIRLHLGEDSSSLFIRPNLASALQSLRLRDTVRYLWIDAVCIDQNDMAERACQVKDMRQVYQNAGRVVVWLGMKTDHTNAAFKYAHSINDQKIEIDLTYVGRAPLNKNDPISRGLSHIFNNEYFERTWCIQEAFIGGLVVAKCDDIEVGFMSLLRTIPMVLANSNTLFRDTTLQTWHSIYLSRRTVNAIKASSREGSMGHLLPLLRQTRPFKVTDPRDKIFGVLGVSDEGVSQKGQAMKHRPIPDDLLVREVIEREVGIENWGHIPKDVPWPDYLQANYSKDPVVLYTEFARYMTRTGLFDLDILSHVQHHKDPSTRTDFPSWVPVWTEPCLCTPLNEHFSAGSCQKALFPSILDSSPSVLSLEGYSVDTVRQTADIFKFPMPGRLRPTEYLDQFTSEIGKAWMQLYPYILDSKILGDYSEEALQDAFGAALSAHPLGITRTTSTTAVYTNSNPPEEFNFLGETPEYSEKLYRECISKLWERIQQQGSASETQNTQSVSSDNSWVSGIMVSTMSCFTKDRRAFVTWGGRIGIGPKMTQPGDEVVVLFGGKVPYVARPRSDHHVFVGDCYVRNDDIMLGRMTEKVRTQNQGPTRKAFNFQ